MLRRVSRMGASSFSVSDSGGVGMTTRLATARASRMSVDSRGTRPAAGVDAGLAAGCGDGARDAPARGALAVGAAAHRGGEATAGARAAWDGVAPAPRPPP